MRTLVATVFALLIASSLAGQATRQAPKRAAPPSSSGQKLISIKVTGSERYTPEQIAASTNLQIGEEVSEDNFKEATQLLGETGLFTNVAYGYSYSSLGTKLELQVTDNSQLVPVVFDNVVWYTDQQLIDEIRRHVPLFQGRVALSGGLVDQVADVIAALIAERNPQFHADYLRSGPLGGPIDSIVFTVTGAQIRIRNLEFPGASSALIEALATVAGKVQDADYLRSRLALFAKMDATPVYLKRGFLKVSFGEAQAQVVSDTTDGTVVDVKLPVTEGIQYKLAAVEWTGNSILPADKLQPLIRGKAGDVANAVQLEQDFEAVRRLYGSRGYVKATTTPQLKFDDAASTVAYTVQVKEGELYRMGDLDIEGLDSKTVARLRTEWKLRQGEPYDCSYPKRFFTQSEADLPTDVRWKVTVHETVNDSDKTVDVTLQYSSNGP